MAHAGTARGVSAKDFHHGLLGKFALLGGPRPSLKSMTMSARDGSRVHVGVVAIVIELT